MVWAEIILIVIGIIFIGVSFYVTEKLSQQDLEQISLMSEMDLKIISERQVKEMKEILDNRVEDIMDECLDIAQRGLEKETNSKIMAVSEYSDTVLESINKAHNEITFIYSMLNEKQTETAQLIGDLQKITKQIRDMDLENSIAKAESVADNMRSFEPIAVPVVDTTAEEVTVINETTNLMEFSTEEEEAVLSKSEQILLLYKEGKNEVEIAKTLGCGLGEVRLVLGLYRNEA